MMVIVLSGGQITDGRINDGSTRLFDASCELRRHAIGDRCKWSNGNHLTRLAQLGLAYHLTRSRKRAQVGDAPEAPLLFGTSATHNFSNLRPPLPALPVTSSAQHCVNRNSVDIEFRCKDEVRFICCALAPVPHKPIFMPNGSTSQVPSS